MMTVAPIRFSVFFCILGKNLQNHLRRKRLNENKFSLKLGLKSIDL